MMDRRAQRLVCSRRSCRTTNLGLPHVYPKTSITPPQGGARPPANPSAPLPVLLTEITSPSSSNGVQSGVGADLQPRAVVVEDRALKPARDLVDWFDKTFDAAWPRQPAARQARAGSPEGGCAETRRPAENAGLRKLPALSTIRLGRSLPATEPVTGRVIARSATVWSPTSDLRRRQ